MLTKREKTMNKQPTFLTASWDAWRTARKGKERIAQRQQERLQELVTYARTQSSYYAQVYRDVPEQVTTITQSPEGISWGILCQRAEEGRCPGELRHSDSSRR